MSCATLFRWLLPLTAAATALLAAAPAEAVTAPVYDDKGQLIEVPFVPPAPEPELTEENALELATRNEKVAAWIARYPREGISEEASFDPKSNSWVVKVWAKVPDSDPPDTDQIVLARVDDSTGRVTEAWTGPQVAWTMARGSKGSFGKSINKDWIWWPLAAAFLIGLADLRRPLALRNLDLLALVSFSASWWFFNEGEIFTSVPLAYPPLVYLLLRMLWIGIRDRPVRAGRPVWPVWALAIAAVFLAGLRFGLNVADSNVIDVGYAGVIGAQRIVGQGEMPYGHMPVHEGPECGPADANGNVRDRIQTNGRCESANDRGDTYGPITYIAYIPGYLAFGWSGKWDSLPAAHFTALLFDALTLVGLALVGWRFGRARLAATLTFAWTAYPFTQYVSSTNSNDAIVPCFLVWGFWLVSSPLARGLFVGLASFAKFAALLVAPLWASYPTGLRRPRAVALFVAGFLLAAALGFWVLLLEPDPLEAARAFYDRTFGFQLGRDSPFSIWNWGVYPGYPDLGLWQAVLKVALVVSAFALAFVPRVKSELQLAALSAFLLVGFELVLTHWFYLYIPWFLPFVAFVLCATPRPLPQAAEETDDEPVPELARAAG